MPILQPSRSTYLTQIRQITQDEEFTSYTGKTLLNVEELPSGGYKCLLKRYDVQLGQVSSSIAHRLIIELGESLYPIELEISPDKVIRRVINFEEIKERRTSKAEELLSCFSTGLFRKYIEMSQHSLKDEEALRKALLRDTFIQLFFSCASENSFYYTCDNFPRKGKKSCYYCEIDKREEDACFYTARPAFSCPSHEIMEGSIVSNISGKSGLVGIKAAFMFQREEEVYRREIEISILSGDDTIAQKSVDYGG